MRCEKCGHFISSKEEHTCPDKKWNKDRIKGKLKRISNQLGHSPTCKDIKEFRGSEDLIAACYRHFGSFNEAKKKAGLETYCWEGYEGKWSKNKVKKELKEVADRLKHSPTIGELREIDRYDLVRACEEYLGSFSKAKEEVGLSTYSKEDRMENIINSIQKWTKERVKKELREVADTLNHSPTALELRNMGKSGLIDACFDRFGSFNRAKEKVNLETRPKPNRLEGRIIEICEKFDLPFKYVGNGKFTIKNLNPDFVNCNGKKQVIEVYGDFWHKEKENIDWKRTEFGRKAIFSQLGFDTLILWEHWIKNHSDKQITNRIKSFKNG